jgi:hypothetical protein
VKASYEASMLIAKAGKPHIIAEELILPAAKAMVSAMVGEKSSGRFKFGGIVWRHGKKRIYKISDKVKEQLIERICKSQN